MAAVKFRAVCIGIALLAIYVAAGKFGLSLAFVHPAASSVWPPTGIALSALLLLGYRYWPAILAGAFIVNLTSGSAPVVSAAIAIGNTLEALCGAWLVNRFAGGTTAFATLRGVFVFAALAGLASTVLSATIGVTALALGGTALWRDFAGVWTTWWLGDVAGALLVTPVLVSWGAKSHDDGIGRRWPEAVSLLVVNGLLAAAMFGDLLTIGERSLPSFLCLPPLMWAVFRFGPRETATVTLLVTGVAVAGTAAGLGPFSGIAPNDSLLLLQTFMAVIATFALASAATVNERRLADATRADRLRLEELARARAEDLNRARDQFLATVSHELRTPLNSMLAWVGLARSDDTDIAVLRSAIDVFERNIRQHIRLIEDLLDISHMNAGRFHLESREVELRAIVEAAVNAIGATAAANGLTIGFEGETARVNGDPDRLQQVVTNLLSNAVKFTPAGGRIRVTLSVEGDAAVVAVTDSGQGIDPAFMPYLFEPFRQAAAPETRRHGGLGLGLSIVRHLVEAHGGTVCAGPGDAGTGTQFTVRLPRAGLRRPAAVEMEQGST